MREKYLFGITIAVLIVGTGWYLFFQSKTPEGKPIEIGAIFALTGNAASYGEWAKNAIDLAIEDINTEGGVNGQPIAVRYEDNEGQAAKAVSAYQKLTAIDGVRYVMTFQSSIALAIAPLANADKILQMDVSATTPNYSTPDDFTFRTGIVANQLAVEAARYLEQSPGTGKVAILYINNDFGSGMRDIFRKSYSGEVVAEETFAQDSFDFRTPLAKVHAAKPDTVFLVSHLKEAGTLVKQASNLGITANFFSDVYAIEGPDFLAAAGDTANGVRYLAPRFDISDAKPEIATFVTKYREEYTEDPNAFAAQAYDGIIALLYAMEGCEYEDTECVRKNLYKLEFEGTSGRISFDINGDTQKPVQLKMVQNGLFVTEPQ